MPLGEITEEELAKELANINGAVVDRGVHIREVEKLAEKEVEEDKFVKDKIKEAIAGSESFTEATPVLVGQVLSKYTGGRNKGDGVVPDGIRKLIAQEHLEHGARAKDLSDVFDVSRQSVDAYSNGKKSVGKRGREFSDEGLELFVTQTRGRIRDKASARLISALDHITESKLVDAKVDVLANVARSMSGIVKEMTPQEKGDGGEGHKGVTIQFFSPSIKREESYEVLDLQQPEA